MKTLHLARTPVDRVAARIVHGEMVNFIPSIDPGGTGNNRTKTWRYPPVVLGVMPDGGRDWTGHRYGRMTAMYWYRPQSKADIWVVRCDCGNYEIRRPELWDKDCAGRWIRNDACNICRATDIVCSRVKKSGDIGLRRRDAWIARMLSLGLTINEVAELLVNPNIESHLEDVEHIRALIIAARIDSNPDGRPIDPRKVLTSWARTILFGGAA